MSAPATPKLTRIRYATLGAPDVAAAIAIYTRWLDYTVVADGIVSAAMAESWGCPNSAGRRCVDLAAPANPSHRIRVIATDAPAYRPFTSYGWNAVEIIVDDLDALAAHLAPSPFRVLAPPAPIPGTSLRAMQVEGPAGEVLYLTTEAGDRAKSTLPIPKSQVDRPFVVVIAGADVTALRERYAGLFALTPTPIFPIPIPMIATAQGMSLDHKYPITVLRGAERGNAVELDEYPAGLPPRAQAAGQILPGVAMASFIVARLDAFDVPWIATPRKLYDGARAASFVGPAGELIELIEG